MHMSTCTSTNRKMFDARVSENWASNCRSELGLAVASHNLESRHRTVPLDQPLAIHGNKPILDDICAFRKRCAPTIELNSTPTVRLAEGSRFE